MNVREDVDPSSIQLLLSLRKDDQSVGTMCADGKGFAPITDDDFWFPSLNVDGRKEYLPARSICVGEIC